MSEHFRKYIKKEHFPVQPSNIKFKTSFRNCIHEALKRRTWKETDHETDWDIYWTEKEWINEVMGHIHLAPHQKVNHFRNYYELCRKDNLIKNIKKHKKALEKEGKLDEAASYNFCPVTYNLPGEYSIFCEEFKKNSKDVWIMKPIGKSQGKGIFLFNKLSQVSQWKNDTRWKPDAPQVENYIVQRYISNPLLIGGKKFDIRIYCLVTSYSPLVAYLYRDGFARFTHHRYSNDDITNTYVHLTNVAIQKTSENYDEKLGGKWDLRTLKLYLVSKYGQAAVSASFAEIQQVIVRSLQSVQKHMINDKHCFELYGFDILLDDKLKPWLIEVNGSPSMTANTTHDFELKTSLLDDVFTVLDLEKILTGQEEQIGGFDLICKGQPIRNEPSMFSTMLSCHNNRLQQLKKLAKTISLRLTQAYNQEKEESKKKDKDIPSLSTTDTSSANSSKPKTKVVSRTNPLIVAAKGNRPFPPTRQNTAVFPSKEPKETREVKEPATASRVIIKGKYQDPAIKSKTPLAQTGANVTNGGFNQMVSSFTMNSNPIGMTGAANNEAVMANNSTPFQKIAGFINQTNPGSMGSSALGGQYRPNQPMSSTQTGRGSSTLKMAGASLLQMDMRPSHGKKQSETMGEEARFSYSKTSERNERVSYGKDPYELTSLQIKEQSYQSKYLQVIGGDSLTTEEMLNQRKKGYPEELMGGYMHGGEDYE